MYMDNIKVFAKDEKELENLVPTIRICSQVIGMKSDIEKCARPIIKNTKREGTEGIDLPNQERIRFREKENYKCLEILDTIKLL